jgi:mercuric ion transport protein
LASPGAAIGLGFLAGYEGIFINTLLQIFAAIALLAKLVSWF